MALILFSRREIFVPNSGRFYLICGRSLAVIHSATTPPRGRRPARMHSMESLADTMSVSSAPGTVLRSSVHCQGSMPQVSRRVFGASFPGISFTAGGVLFCCQEHIIRASEVGPAIYGCQQCDCGE